MARFRAFDSDNSEDEESRSSSSSSSSSPFSKIRPKTTKQDASQKKKPKTLSSVSSASSVEEVSEDDDGSETEDDSDIIERELGRSYVDEEEEEEDDIGMQDTMWPERMDDLEPQRFHVMQTSLFRMPELAKSMSVSDLQQSKRPFNHPGSNQLKHPRESFIDQAKKVLHPLPPLPRSSFLQPRAHPPSNKYIRVAAATESVAAEYEGVYADAGLCFGRSFRAGWGPGGRLVHLGQICRPGAVPSGTKSTNLHLTKVRLSNDTTLPDLLSCLLARTPIEPASDERHGTPYVEPNQSLTFSTFESLFAPSDSSQVSSLFRLGHALFDPIDIRVADSVSFDVRNRILALRRTVAFSSWLAKSVEGAVEKDLRANAADDSAKIAFLHLTGNQIEKAVDTLTDGGNIRLATLVSQAPGDEDFRTDIQEQLQIWKADKLDTLIGQDIRKIYALLAGIVDVLEGSNTKEDLELMKGLDWLRTLGLLLWFESSLDTPLSETFERYEILYENQPGRIAGPTPWYSSESLTNESDIGTHNDAQFSLMKLALSPSMTMESALSPLGFGANPRDFKLPWFMYVLLSRCMRMRDFTDREVVEGSRGEEDEEDENSLQDGYSPTADALTANYAAQLEQDGLIQEAVFVLLFLEEDVGRKRAIKDLLCRMAPSLDEWSIAGIHGSLKIPREWIDEAQAAHELDKGEIYKAYELYLQAGIDKIAHELAITYLAPEAIIRGDLVLLRQLFDAMDQNKIPDWTIGGQLFIDYATIMTRIPELRKQLENEDEVPDASESTELASLTVRIPKLIGVLPDAVREKPGSDSNAVLSTMLSNLLGCLTISPTTRVDIPSGLVNEAARLKYIGSATSSSFLKTIELAA